MVVFIRPSDHSNFPNTRRQIEEIMGHYCIDRCELWRFIHEINSDISHVKYQFFPARTTFRQL